MKVIAEKRKASEGIAKLKANSNSKWEVVMVAALQYARGKGGSWKGRIQATQP